MNWELWGLQFLNLALTAKRNIHKTDIYSNYKASISAGSCGVQNVLLNMKVAYTRLTYRQLQSKHLHWIVWGPELTVKHEGNIHKTDI